ncbi:MAG: hypothetical protein AseanaTS_26400 [Candidatus Pelagadaptatus aseana]
MLADPDLDMAQFEADKIKGAIRTDFILSAEIIVIALGTAQGADFSTQVIVVSLIAAAMTVGVYSLVAAIVKLDDGALLLMAAPEQNGWGRFKRAFGERLLDFCPKLMKGLSFLGTAAMFLVGGGILVHGIEPLNHLIHDSATVATASPALGNIISSLIPTLLNGLVGLVAGTLLVVIFEGFQKLKER